MDLKNLFFLFVSIISLLLIGCDEEGPGRASIGNGPSLAGNDANVTPDDDPAENDPPDASGFSPTAAPASGRSQTGNNATKAFEEAPQIPAIKGRAVCRFKEDHLIPGLRFEGETILLAGIDSFLPLKPLLLKDKALRDTSVWWKWLVRAGQLFDDDFVKTNTEIKPHPTQKGQHLLTEHFRYDTKDKYSGWCHSEYSECHAKIQYEGFIEKGKRFDYIYRKNLKAKIFFEGRVLNFSPCTDKTDQKNLSSKQAPSYQHTFIQDYDEVFIGTTAPAGAKKEAPLTIPPVHHTEGATDSPQGPTGPTGPSATSTGIPNPPAPDTPTATVEDRAPEETLSEEVDCQFIEDHLIEGLQIEGRNIIIPGEETETFFSSIILQEDPEEGWWRGFFDDFNLIETEIPHQPEAGEKTLIETFLYDTWERYGELCDPEFPGCSVTVSYTGKIQESESGDYVFQGDLIANIHFDNPTPLDFSHCDNTGR